MLKRKIMSVLEEWKRTKKRKCLLLKGVRQCGKTFIIREFAKQNYKNLIEINFFTNPELKEIFEGSLEMKEIIKKATIKMPNAEFIPGKTLLFLDEIQRCGNARTALKFIAEDDQIDCIASGSMLGIAYNTTESIPVGYEDQIEMYSLDFEEFLWALGFSEVPIGYMKEYFDEKSIVPSSSNDAMIQRIREYMIVGGMPEVVVKYIETNNFGEVHKLQNQIINSYLDDIAKYAPESEKPKARGCYLSIPTQLAKENKKFQYSIVEKGSTSKKFSNSLEWLRDAGLIRFCNNVTNPLFPLPAYDDSAYFKIYLTDIGILNAMYGFEMKAAIYYNTLKGPAKGGIYENLVADILMKKDIPLKYYKPGEGRQEIEFLLTRETEIIPLEVKAGNGRTISLDEFIERFDPPYALKLISGNVGHEGKKITLPHWMAMFL
jgi:predicted AAA+ superfamily ATPase